SGAPKFYERFGVKTVRRFVQDGDIAAGRLRTGGRVIMNKARAQKYLNTIEMYERYQFLCLIFFLLTSLHVAANGRIAAALIIAACNVIYNVYPILLQQYNKARILKLSGFAVKR
ncbi:MAG TPA: hypothetical protein VHP30_11745, partial [Ignavibacteriales bacterium]|nr:hypothetical protein [Ignavibacteriales bacterium]